MAFVAPMLTAVAAHPIAALAVGAGTYFAGKTLLGSMSGSSSMPSLTPAPAAPTYEQAEETSREEALDLLRRKRASTTLTSSQGLLSTGETTTKTLLGS